jgi:hypothetical protein
MPIVVTLLPLGALGFLVDEAFERALIVGSLVLATARLAQFFLQSLQRFHHCQADGRIL